MELDYDLPQSLIAQRPRACRSASRLLAVNRERHYWEEHAFSELANLLDSDDLLVLNNTRVLPARFFLKRETGGRIEGLWLDTLSGGDWHVVLRGGSRLRIGEVVRFDQRATQYEVTVLEKGERGLFRLGIDPASDHQVILQDVGHAPLPPYIKRSSTSDGTEDIERYQTVFARHAGAVAAPTAGLHFDDELLGCLESKGVQCAEVTLHVGLGTFQPLGVEDLAEHVMHEERYHVEEDQWELIRQARSAGRRIVAVGTTSARTLEAIARTDQISGRTDLFIYPPYIFSMVDALNTNFHLPRSTFLAMIYAFCGTSFMRSVYQHAIDQRYRFFSYGDAMLIE